MRGANSRSPVHGRADRTRRRTRIGLHAKASRVVAFSTHQACPALLTREPTTSGGGGGPRPTDGEPPCRKGPVLAGDAAEARAGSDLRQGFRHRVPRPAVPLAGTIGTLDSRR